MKKRLIALVAGVFLLGCFPRPNRPVQPSRSPRINSCLVVCYNHHSHSQYNHNPILYSDCKYNHALKHRPHHFPLKFLHNFGHNSSSRNHSYSERHYAFGNHYNFGPHNTKNKLNHYQIIKKQSVVKQKTKKHKKAEQKEKVKKVRQVNPKGRP